MRRTRNGVSAANVRLGFDPGFDPEVESGFDPEVESGFDPGGGRGGRGQLPRVRACVRACAYAGARTCVRVRVCACACAGLKDLIKEKQNSDPSLSLDPSPKPATQLFALREVVRAPAGPPSHSLILSKVFPCLGISKIYTHCLGNTLVVNKIYPSHAYASVHTYARTDAREITPPTPPLFLVHSKSETDSPPNTDSLRMWVQGLLPGFIPPAPTPQSVALAKWVKTKPHYPRRTIAKQEQVRDDLDKFLETEDWSTAKPIHLVELYSLLHKAVYKVDAVDLLISINRQACARVVMNHLTEHFNRDVLAMVQFIRWTWEREESLLVWRTKKHIPQKRISWRRQFSLDLLTEYFIHRASQHGAQ